MAYSDTGKTEPAFLSIREAADRWNVSRDIVYDLVGSGTLEAVKFGRNWRIPMLAILNYEQAHSNQHKPGVQRIPAKRQPVLRV